MSVIVFETNGYVSLIISNQCTEKNLDIHQIYVVHTKNENMMTHFGFLDIPSCDIVAF